MELKTDLTLPVISLVNDDVFFGTSDCCEIECLRITELTNIICINFRVTCTIKLNIKEEERGRYLL